VHVPVKFRPAKTDEQNHADANQLVDFFKHAELTAGFDEEFLAELAACFIEAHWTLGSMLAVYKKAT